MALVYLDDFLELIEELPAEMKTRFTELRRLDSLYQAHLQRGEEKQVEFFRNAKSQPKAALQEQSQPVMKEFSSAKRVIKDKKALIDKAKEMYDRILEHLDDQLKDYEQELESQNPGCTVELKERSLLLDTEEMPYHEIATKGSRAPLKPRSSHKGGNPLKKRKSAHVQAQNTHIIEEENPGEVFCYCRQGSFGQMIGCDNPKCAIEWFHYACVGLTSAPQGSWFCPDCKKARKKA